MTRHRARWWRDAEGSATVWMLGVAGVLATALVAFAGIAAAVTARHRAGAAADLAALAAAARATGAPDTACAVADRTARSNGARLSDCRLDGAVVDVTVTVPLSGVLSRLGPARGRARAGPVTARPAGGATPTPAPP